LAANLHFLVALYVPRCTGWESLIYKKTRFKGAIQITRDTLEGRGSMGKCQQMPQGGDRGLTKVSRGIFLKILTIFLYICQLFRREKKACNVMSKNRPKKSHKIFEWLLMKGPFLYSCCMKI
jgi:hypothetical protein